ncbi:MAG: hypothetical protein AB4426_34305 [Xenococcaceae cyanobacterium]
MSEIPPMPDPEKVKQTVRASRRRRQEMELAGLQLEEVIAKLEHYNRQRRIMQLQRVLNSSVTESQLEEPNPQAVSS